MLAETSRGFDRAFVGADQHALTQRKRRWVVG